MQTLPFFQMTKWHPRLHHRSGQLIQRFPLRLLRSLILGIFFHCRNDPFLRVLQFNRVEERLLRLLYFVCGPAIKKHSVEELFLSIVKVKIKYERSVSAGGSIDIIRGRIVLACGCLTRAFRHQH